MSNQAILRITQEIRQIQRGRDLSLAITYNESDIRRVKALIVGPPDTPYQFGFFELSIKFPRDYPDSPPKVSMLTTNSGQCRFNPNVYSEGKVCLSILGTWPGPKDTQWSSAQGLESVLISIQSLLSSNPYENEPGYENAKSERDKKAMADYIAKIRHETLRIAVIQPLEESLKIQNHAKASSSSEDISDQEDEDRQSVQKFDDLRKRRFLWYYESYMNTIDLESKNVKVNQQFRFMDFECSSNGMEGVFNYPELKKRLMVINDEIMNETRRWPAEGLKAKKDESIIATNLYRQYQQVVEDFHNRKNFSLDLSLEDDNPFVWQATYFGRPMTNLDGGIFKIKIYLSTKFPNEQPRVFIESSIFHHRVSKDGVLCYFTNHPDELRYHIDAILQVIEDESPPFDPRTKVNLEAAKLFWGTPEERRQYNRALRRSVEESIV